MCRRSGSSGNAALGGWICQHARALGAQEFFVEAGVVRRQRVAADEVEQLRQHALEERDGPWGQFMAKTIADWHRSGKLIETEKKWSILPSAFLKKAREQTQ